VARSTAETDATSSPEEWKSVPRGSPFQWTTEAATKSLPGTRRAKASEPADDMRGVEALKDGEGLVRLHNLDGEGNQLGGWEIPPPSA